MDARTVAQRSGTRSAASGRWAQPAVCALAWLELGPCAWPVGSERRWRTGLCCRWSGCLGVDVLLEVALPQVKKDPGERRPLRRAKGQVSESNCPPIRERIPGARYGIAIRPGSGGGTQGAKTVLRPPTGVIRRGSRQEAESLRSDSIVTQDQPSIPIDPISTYLPRFQSVLIGPNRF